MNLLFDELETVPLQFDTIAGALKTKSIKIRMKIKIIHTFTHIHTHDIRHDKNIIIIYVMYGCGRNVSFVYRINLFVTRSNESFEIATDKS